MSQSCDSNCSECSKDCSSRNRESMLEPMNRVSNIKKVYGVVSGKGGVGKSFVSGYLSALMNKKGYSTAIMDADVTGPSIPKQFGIKNRVTEATDDGLIPIVSDNGTKIMSINLLLENDEVPVIWRGPVVAGTVKQFWSQVCWGDVDYMFVDMPPGTSDVTLTVFQSVPLDGIIIVTSPQELVSMIVAKAVNMANSMNVPIVGIVENYSYLECPDCGRQIEVFGKSHIEETASKFNLPVLARIPINPEVARYVDEGRIEELKVPYLDGVADAII